MTTTRALGTACIVLLVGLFALSPAGAQVDRSPTDGPSRGLHLPDRSITTQSDATSTEINPAGLGFMENAEFLYGFDLRTRGGDQLNLSDQHGVLLGAGNSWIAGGLGAQWLQSPSLGERFDSYQKYSFATAVRPSEGMSIGLAAHVFGSASRRSLHGQTALDVGFQWRPSPFVGAGLALRDVNHPFLSPDRGLPLKVLPGLALRLFRGSLILDNQFQWTVSNHALSWTPRIRTEPIAGVGVYGRAEIPLRSPDHSPVVTVTAGLDLSLGRAGIRSAGTVRPEAQDETPGLAPLSSTIRISSRPHVSVLQPINRWIEIDLTQNIGERGSQPLFGPARTSLLELLTKIRAAGDDPSIEGVVVSVGNDLGYAQAWELRQALASLQSAGKKVAAFMESSSFVDTYLASVANRVWLPPSEPYTPEGLHTTRTNYADALASIGIEAEFVRIGEYKSAPESYIRSNPSKENLEQTTAYLDTIFDEVVGRISEGRQLDRQTVETTIDEIPISPNKAVKRRLVDDVLYHDELDVHLREQFGALRFLESNYDPTPSPTRGWEGRQEIAVLHINGMITSGSSGRAPLIGGVVTGSETVGRVIDQLARDRDVRGVVVRIDSPGGSATASDRIYRDLRRLARRKPVVASMGNVAASGGYYVAAGADEIYATPNTITGSIGIFAGKFSGHRLLGRIGVNNRDIERGEVAGRRSLLEPWSRAERQSVAREIHYLYRLFLNQAARTRPLSKKELDQIARGRVWSGRAADERKLVDGIGGLLEAIRRAEVLAGLEPGGARYRAYPRRKGLLNLPSNGVAARLVERFGGDKKRKRLGETAIGEWLEGIGRRVALPLFFEPREPLMLPHIPLTLD